METGENNMNQGAPQSSEAPQAAPSSTTAASTPLVASGEKKTLMAVLAYIGILILIPYFMAKDDAFVKYHIKQGLVLIVISLIVWAVGEVMWGFKPVLGLLNLAIFILAIVGIVNAIQGKEKELPLVGPFAKHFNNV